MLANMRPFSLACIYGYAYTPRSANAYTRIHVSAYLRLESQTIIARKSPGRPNDVTACKSG